MIGDEERNAESEVLRIFEVETPHDVDTTCPSIESASVRQNLRRSNELATSFQLFLS